ncbi:hypothetical protein OPU71_18485 [Niveibacterium sp. 24ML]|uniref:hypothetical protein n=1 Tax=Niveibacterium sp. 24ML TaxID=2985512 RepID=UPI00226EF1B9|nr:hypothetical protein [Niveibacterium sp. 24ML]MCX9158114.1 hypothetical protein [Niveibacterium sp. 24ML]
MQEQLRPDHVSHEAEHRRQQAIASAILTQYHRLDALGHDAGADPIAIEQARQMVQMIQQRLLESQFQAGVDLSAFWRTDTRSLPGAASARAPMSGTPSPAPAVDFISRIQGKAGGARLNAEFLARLQGLGVLIEHALPYDEDPDRL